MNVQERIAVIEDYFGRTLSWVEEDEDRVWAYMKCPGEHLHTTKDQPRDAKIFATGSCFIHCFHTHCMGLRNQTSAAIRIMIGEQKPMTQAEKKEHRQRIEIFIQAKEFAGLILQVLPEIYGRYATSSSALIPRLSPREQSIRFLSLFEPDQVLWIGQEHNSGPVHGIGHFRKVADWIGNKKFFQFVCPGVFDSASRTARSREGIVAWPYRVLEFDRLDPDPIQNKLRSLALVHALEEQLGLEVVAQIDSGGKSIHSWCRNNKEIFTDLVILTLVELGADPSSLKRPGQIVRFPGVPRDEFHQQSLLLNTYGV